MTLTWLRKETTPFDKHCVRLAFPQEGGDCRVGHTSHVRRTFGQAEVCTNFKLLGLGGLEVNRTPVGRPVFKTGEGRWTSLVGSTPTLFRQAILEE